jgi:hypothetical protein
VEEDPKIQSLQIVDTGMAPHPGKLKVAFQNTGVEDLYLKMSLLRSFHHCMPQERRVAGIVVGTAEVR